MSMPKVLAEPRDSPVFVSYPLFLSLFCQSTPYLSPQKVGRPTQRETKGNPMHQPSTHPNVTPELAGRGRRYVIQTHAKRPIRLDRISDAALLWSKAQLSVAGNPRDAASCSLVVRRAVRLYERYLCSLMHDDDDGKITAERKAVRALSQMPGPKPRQRRKPKEQPQAQTPSR